LRENVAASGGRLTGEELTRLGALLDGTFAELNFGY
jgi:hypothetical protein